MLVKQLSVFVENKFGRLETIISELAKNNINISALSMADTTDFGILRIIVDNPEKAQLVLKEAGVVGMGGAGFPTHVKLSVKNPEKIDYVIANCAECEPLLRLHRNLLEKNAHEILWALDLISQTIGAKKRYNCVKSCL